MPVQWRGLACAPFKPADIITQPATAFCKSCLGRVAYIAGLAIAQGAKAGVNVDEAKTLGMGKLTIDQRAIERSDWDLFRATGVAHLMSISGLHITMFAWAAALAVGSLWRRSAGLCRLWPAPRCEWRRIGYQCGGVKGSQPVV